MSAIAQVVFPTTIPIKRDGRIKDVEIAGCGSLDDLAGLFNEEEEGDFFLEGNFDLGEKDTRH